jgi:transposase InsO family protein
MGKSLHIKTDDGPGYTSAAFKAFCSSYKILHTTGIPYNPQGQAIVEQAHQTLKVQLQRQEGGESSPDTQINKALFTLNFFNCSESGLTPAEKHWEHHSKQLLP